MRAAPFPVRRRAARATRAALVALAALVVAGGCAGRRMAREAESRARAAADAHVLDGCYDCLREARDAYARLDSAARDGARRDSIAVRRFETELLLALREKELALDPAESVARARALAPRLPAAVEPRRVLDLVDAVLPDPQGTPDATRGALLRRQTGFLARIPGELAWLAGAPLTPAVREYVRLAVDCTHGRRLPSRRPAPGAGAAPPTAPAAAVPPLVAYRAASCDRTDTTRLRAVLAAVPRFAEAAYQLARPATMMAAETGGDDARPLVEQAYARFPRSPGVTFLAGWLESAVGDCAAALRFLDETVALAPLHETAWLERTVCLTRLERDTAAIASATRVVALGGGRRALGYYWRAVNRHRRGELPVARADVDSAKGLSDAATILTLAGVIEHDQDDLAIAETDLRAARAAVGGEFNCTAASYLARVLVKQARWPDAAGAFEGTMDCYDRRAGVAERELARLRADSTARAGQGAFAAFVARRIAQQAAELAELRRSYHAAAFNSAGARARTGELERARAHLAIAARDPERAEQVARLHAALDARQPR